MITNIGVSSSNYISLKGKNNKSETGIITQKGNEKVLTNYNSSIIAFSAIQLPRSIQKNKVNFSGNLDFVAQNLTRVNNGVVKHLEGTPFKGVAPFDAFLEGQLLTKKDRCVTSQI